jgi:glycosyltransferase involved in cell wall biosynthesis
MDRDNETQSQLRILILGNAAPYRIGGAEIQARRLADGFCHSGHLVTIAGYAMPNAPMHTAHPWSSVNLPVLGKTRILRAISYAFFLARFLSRHRHNIDVIYGRILGESILVAAVLKYVGWIKQPLIACSACAGRSGDAAALENLPVSSWLVHILNRTCNAINILSPDIAKELNHLGLDHKRFTHIPNGVPIINTTQTISRYVNGQKTFLYVGRLSAQKGVDSLLLAAYRLKKHNYGIKLHIVGDGPDRQALYALAGRLGIAEQVVFHGMIDPAQVADFYEKHSIFLLGSRDEGQPNALLEAMAGGMPVIVSASGGAEYLVDETMGIVCSPEDPDAIFTAMSQMLSMTTEQLAGMGASARRHVSSRFELGNVIKQYLQLFKQHIRISE